ncbi:outer membrane protein assembly factor BamB family protein [Plantactinospora endophytica]|uniref:Pyrrolo-quinoline quinone repeat domain-containing protein n=1 Tax=Plantactinospora endophytica TaxID=673535 RepID=A0ABQ4E8X8_9ACTN|nr:PQQ-binding-like beta-propeller repeat protein [Plantactinospora endophytica]GIG91099.1 hypothetical protein Pen02_60350 [Plantactinospora endophytica]
MVVIELGEQRYDPPAEPVPPRRFTWRRLRTTALGLAGALVFGLGGAAPAAPSQLTEIYRGTVQGSDSFTLTEDRLVLTEPLGTDAYRITAYETERGRQLWSTTYRTELRRIWLYQAAGLLILLEGRPDSNDFRTVALDAGTGRWRWSVPSQLTVLGEERIGLVVEEVFPPGSRVDPDNPPPSGTPTYQATWGTGSYTAPPVGQTGRVVDLDTGRDLWTSPVLSGISTLRAGPGRPAALLAGYRDGLLELRDPRTGAVRQRLDSGGGVPFYAAMAGDWLMVRFETNVAVYSADLRQRRWIRATPSEQLRAEACGPMLCLADGSGTEVVDPATGGTAWRNPEPLRVTPHGGHLVETTEDLTIRRTVDPRTGRSVVDLTGWTEAESPATSGPMLLRQTGGSARTWVGLLDPEGTAVRSLDPLPFALTSCQAAPRAFACRTHLGDMRVWRYRPRPSPPG